MHDDELLAALAEAVAADQPPEDARRAAYAAHGWRTVDAELARLLADEELEVVLFQDGGAARRLSYASGGGTIDVGIDGDRFEVAVNPAPRSLRLVQPSDTVDLAVDGLGRASGSGVAGPVRFEIDWSSGRAVTPWITL